jgi:hypothetical protein
MHLPPATIRLQVMLPLRFADGIGATARAYFFNGLTDGREHLALDLGERAAAVCGPGGSPVARLSNYPHKAAQLERLRVTVVARMPIAVHLNATNARYLATKARRGAHKLDLPRDVRLDA